MVKNYPIYGLKKKSDKYSQNLRIRIGLYKFIHDLFVTIGGSSLWKV